MSGKATRRDFKATNRSKLGFSRFGVALYAATFFFYTTSPTQSAIVRTGDVLPSDPASWTSSTISYIGRSDPGTVTVDGGSSMLSKNSYVGYNSGSNGTATITGTDSKWTISNTLTVGLSGPGQLTVGAGAHVISAAGFLGYNHTTGTATITGAGSKWTNSYELYVGGFGRGTLNIEAGGQVSNTLGYLGKGLDSTGTAKVSGAGTTWINSESLYVGYTGSGTLTVADGGVVTATTLYASLSNLFGNGTISVQGAVLDNDLVFDTTNGTQQTIAFGTGGMLNLSPSVSGTLGAGYKGVGTLRIADGENIVSAAGVLGLWVKSNGSATVTGVGSKWTMNGDLRVGSAGRGTLTIEAGGEVRSTKGVLAESYSEAYAKATVTGAGSKWINSDALFVGESTLAILNIQAGGLVSSSHGRLSYGTATVSGEGSKWINSNDLYLGYWEGYQGTLNVGSDNDGGGLVTAKSLIMAYKSGNQVYFNLNNRGILQAGTITKGPGAANFNWNDGTIQNFDAVTDLTISNSNNLVLKLSAIGTHAFDIDPVRTGTIDAILADATSGGTLAKQGEGLLTLTGINTYSGQTTVEAGRFKVTGSILNTSGVDISAGATLELAKTSGSATAGSLAISNAGTVLISAGAQTVGTISGTGVTQVSAGTLTAKSIVQDSLSIGTTGVGASATGDTLNQVPEPGTMVLLLLGAVGAILGWKWQRSRKSV